MALSKTDYRLQGKDLLLSGKDAPPCSIIVGGKEAPASWQQRAIITGYERAKQWVNSLATLRCDAMYLNLFVAHTGDATVEVFMKEHGLIADVGDRLDEIRGSAAIAEVSNVILSVQSEDGTQRFDSAPGKLTITQLKPREGSGEFTLVDTNRRWAHEPKVFAQGDFKDGDHGAADAIAQGAAPDCPLCEAGVSLKAGRTALVIDPATGKPTGEKVQLPDSLVDKIEKAVGTTTGRLSTSEPVEQIMQKDGTIKRMINLREVDVNPSPMGRLRHMDFAKAEVRTVANFAVQEQAAANIHDTMRENLKDAGYEVGTGAMADCVTITVPPGEVNATVEKVKNLIRNGGIPAGKMHIDVVDGPGVQSIPKDPFLRINGIDLAKGRDLTSAVIVDAETLLPAGPPITVARMSRKQKKSLSKFFDSMTSVATQKKRLESLHALTSHLKALELRSHECTDRAKKRKLEGKIARTLVALSHLQG